jgi:hypothetical protein
LFAKTIEVSQVFPGGRKHEQIFLVQKLAMTSFATRFLGKERSLSFCHTHARANKNCQGNLAHLYEAVV